MCRTLRMRFICHVEFFFEDSSDDSMLMWKMMCQRSCAYGLLAVGTPVEMRGSSARPSASFAFVGVPCGKRKPPPPPWSQISRPAHGSPMKNPSSVCLRISNSGGCSSKSC
eukprot:symbB.v1.2.015710.t1/scaffold1183.1/size133355/2